MPGRAVQARSGPAGKVAGGPEPWSGHSALQWRLQPNAPNPLPDPRERLPGPGSQPIQNHELGAAVGGRAGGSARPGGPRTRGRRARSRQGEGALLDVLHPPGLSGPDRRDPLRPRLLRRHPRRAPPPCPPGHQRPDLRPRRLCADLRRPGRPAALAGDVLARLHPVRRGSADHRHLPGRWARQPTRRADRPPDPECSPGAPGHRSVDLRDGRLGRVRDRGSVQPPCRVVEQRHRRIVGLPGRHSRAQPRRSRVPLTAGARRGPAHAGAPPPGAHRHAHRVPQLWRVLRRAERRG